MTDGATSRWRDRATPAVLRAFDALDGEQVQCSRARHPAGQGTAEGLALKVLLETAQHAAEAFPRRTRRALQHHGCAKRLTPDTRLMDALDQGLDALDDLIDLCADCGDLHRSTLARDAAACRGALLRVRAREQNLALARELDTDARDEADTEVRVREAVVLDRAPPRAELDVIADHLDRHAPPARAQHGAASSRVRHREVLVAN